jgi:hypothetical protein
MSKSIQMDLMSTMAEVVPFKHLVKQVQRAIKDYEESPDSQERRDYIVFTAQILLMKHIMEKNKMSAEDLTNEVDMHDKVTSLFNINNN